MLLYLYLGLVVIVRVSYGYGCTRRSGPSITQPTLGPITPVACGTIRYTNWGLNGRTGEMLIKNFVGAQLPFSFFFLPSSFLLFLLSLFPHLSATARNLEGALKLFGGSGCSPAAKRHLMNFGLKECVWCGQFY